MKQRAHFLACLALICGVLSLLAIGLPAAAQGPDVETIEALALRAHLQNLRTESYTFWIGGNLGDRRNAPRNAPIGEVLDRWKLAGMAGDADAALETLARPTLLNFWASWCGPCRIEFPHLAELATAPDAHEFDVLFVNMADSERDALAFLENYPAELHTVLDEMDRLARRGSVNSIPTTMLLDTDGTVLLVHVGVLTPTISAFFDGVAAAPGVGQFIAAEHAQAAPGAELLPVDAAQAEAIAYGARALGTITPGDFQDVYRFEGRAGDQISARLAADSSPLDAYLVLMTADGERLAENDDYNAGTDSQVEVTLPADGTYLLVATRFLEAEGFSAGDYSLTLTLEGPDAAAQPQASEGFLAYGMTIEGRVSGNNPRELYSFVGQAGDVVTLRVTHAPGEVALRIEVKDPAKDRLVVSEESVAGETALVDLELPQDGNYLVIVMRPRSRDTVNLDYTLSLTARD
ncbi:MAG: redoxin family protein [Chloroflexi bacterium]|nr:redoxin family protein [Chloroflexota bacterium]